MSKCTFLSLWNECGHDWKARYQIQNCYTNRNTCSMCCVQAYGANLLMSLEMFTNRKASLVISKVVYAIYIVLIKLFLGLEEKGWSKLQRSSNSITLCLASNIQLPYPYHETSWQSAHDYFCYKTKGHTLLLQGAVDKKSRFLDAFFGLPGTMNDN